MFHRSRGLPALLAASYLLVIALAPLFHTHGVGGGLNGCDGDCGRGVRPVAADSSGPSGGCHSDSDAHSGSSHSPAPSPRGHRDCPVCQYLAQKPAPVAEAVSEEAGEWVQAIAQPAPAAVVQGVFSAWHSRGPPDFA